MDAFASVSLTFRIKAQLPCVSFFSWLTEVLQLYFRNLQKTKADLEKLFKLLFKEKKGTVAFKPLKSRAKQG